MGRCLGGVRRDRRFLRGPAHLRLQRGNRQRLRDSGPGADPRRRLYLRHRVRPRCRHRRRDAVLAAGLRDVGLSGQFLGAGRRSRLSRTDLYIYIRSLNSPWVLFALLGIYVSARLIVDGDYSVPGYRLWLYRFDAGRAAADRVGGRAPGRREFGIEPAACPAACSPSPALPQSPACAAGPVSAPARSALLSSGQFGLARCPDFPPRQLRPEIPS